MTKTTVPMMPASQPLVATIHRLSVLHLMPVPLTLVTLLLDVWMKLYHVMITTLVLMTVVLLPLAAGTHLLFVMITMFVLMMNVILLLDVYILNMDVHLQMPVTVPVVTQLMAAPMIL
jgi:hypothetical protein